MATWTEWLLERAETPPWLKRKWESRLVGLIGYVFDALGESLSRATAAGLVTHPNCPSDGLDMHGRERMMPRFPNESDEDYAVRLQGAWEMWPTAGNRTQLVSMLEGYGFSGVYIVATYEWDGSGYPAWADPAELDNWSRFWIYVPYGGHDIRPDGVWDSPGNWDDGGLWDFENLTQQDVVNIRQLIELYRPAHEIPVRIRFLLEPGSFIAPDVWSGDSISLDMYT